MLNNIQYLKSVDYFEVRNILKEDLRIVKTKKNIKKVLMELLQIKPVHKITVTELAEKAMINKGTFYLHYSDIYSLYEEVILEFIEDTLGSYEYYEQFFTDPRGFVSKFLKDFQKNDFQKAFPFFEPSKEKFPIPFLITETILKHIAEINYVPDTTENRIRFQCCISALTSTMFHFRDTDIEVITDILAEMIRKVVIENDAVVSAGIYPH